jgi:DNA-binding winged helix-turn-helix (wHTH) protein
MSVRTYLFGRASNPTQFELVVDQDTPTILLERGQRVHIEPTALKLLFLLIRYKDRRYSNERIVSLVKGEDVNVNAEDFASHHIKAVRKARGDQEPFELILNERGIGYLFGGTVRMRDAVSHALEPPRLPLPGYLPPRVRSPFLGRDADLEQIKNMLGIAAGASGGSRQAIVTGLPGVGKTTLASVLSYEGEIQEAYPDGVLWTSLDKRPSLMSTDAEATRINAEWRRICDIVRRNRRRGSDGLTEDVPRLIVRYPQRSARALACASPQISTATSRGSAAASDSLLKLGHRPRPAVHLRRHHGPDARHFLVNGGHPLLTVAGE